MQSTAKTSVDFSFFPDTVLSGKATLRFPDIAGKFRTVRKNSGRLATLPQSGIPAFTSQLQSVIEFLFVSVSDFPVGWRLTWAGRLDTT